MNKKEKVASREKKSLNQKLTSILIVMLVLTTMVGVVAPLIFNLMAL